MKKNIMFFLTVLILLVLPLVNSEEITFEGCLGQNPIKGDLNNDGTLTAGDLQIFYGLLYGTITPEPGMNVCCADINNDGSFTAGDMQSITEAIFNGIDLGTCYEDDIPDVFEGCSENALIGDLTGDGSITMRDHQWLYSLVFGYMDVEDNANICCADPNGDGSFTAEDMQMIYGAIFEGDDLGVCVPNEKPTYEGCVGVNPLKGDANGDGSVTAGDLQIMYQLVFGEMNLPEEGNICCVDLDGNGIVTAGDMQEANNYLFGYGELEYCSPVNEEAPEQEQEDEPQLTTSEPEENEEAPDQEDEIPGVTLTNEEENIPGPTTTSGKSSEEEVEYVLNCALGIQKGDLNGNGEVTMEDQQILYALVMGEFVPETDANICCADLNNDGEFTAEDMQMIHQIIFYGEKFGYCSKQHYRVKYPYLLEQYFKNPQLLSKAIYWVNKLIFF